MCDPRARPTHFIASGPCSSEFRCAPASFRPSRLHPFAVARPGVALESGLSRSGEMLDALWRFMLLVIARIDSRRADAVASTSRLAVSSARGRLERLRLYARPRTLMTVAAYACGAPVFCDWSVICQFVTATPALHLPAPTSLAFARRVRWQPRCTRAAHTPPDLGAPYECPGKRGRVVRTDVAARRHARTRNAGRPP